MAADAPPAGDRFRSQILVLRGRTGLTGVTAAQRAALLALGAIEQAPASSNAPDRAH